MSAPEGVLAEIRIYPVKALDPVRVDACRITSGGSLEGDRRWALFGADGAYVNGKKTAAVHGIRASYHHGDEALLSSNDGAEPARFSLTGDLASLEQWLSRSLAQPVTVRRSDDGGFPDDLKWPGPTLVAGASFEAVRSWFPDLGAEDVRLRFRANLEIAGVPAFWEDRLCGPEGTAVRIRIGDVEVDVVNPCQRCVVPSRDPRTGEALGGFQKRFADRRRASLPPWADRSRFDHFYRFTVNTRIPPTEAGKMVRVGDPVVIVGETRRPGTL